MAADLCLRIHPDDLSVQLLRGRTLVELRRTAEAQAILAQLANSNDEEERVRALVGLGRMHQLAGRHEEAIAAFQQASDHYPAEAAYRVLVARGYFLLGELDRASSTYNEASRLEGGPADEALANLGSVQRSQLRYRRALATLKRQPSAILTTLGSLTRSKMSVAPWRSASPAGPGDP